MEDAAENQVLSERKKVRDENERLKAELQRKDEALREVSAREAELKRQRDAERNDKELRKAEFKRSENTLRQDDHHQISRL